MQKIGGQFFVLLEKTTIAMRTNLISSLIRSCIQVRQGRILMKRDDQLQLSAQLSSGRRLPSFA